MALTNKKQLKISTGTKTNGKVQAPPNAPTAKAPTRWDIITFIVGAITIALIGLLFTTAISYWSFAQSVFNDYRDQLDQAKYEKYIRLDERVKELEIMYATPTFIPKPT